MAPRKMPRPRVLEWSVGGMLLRAFIVGERKLGITLVNQDGMWTGVGVESTARSIEGVFAQHSHVVLEPRPDLVSAMAAADECGNKWLAAAGHPIAAPCDCEEIPELTSASGQFTVEELKAMIRDVDTKAGDPTP